MFDRYIAADWSASGSPKTGENSISICNLGLAGDPITTNPQSRARAEEQLRDLLTEAIDHGDRVLIGLDFPYGYHRARRSTWRLDRVLKTQFRTVMSDVRLYRY